MISMIKRCLERTVPIVLLWAVAVDVILVGAVLVAKGELRTARAEYGRDDGSGATPIPSGYGLDGAPVQIADRQTSYAIWFASSKCPYCQKDREWPALASALEKRGVRVLILLPKASESFESGAPLPGNARQVAYINADWLKRYPLSVTPTLLIFDKDQRLIWRRYGMLKPADAKDALRTIDRAIGAS